MIQAINGRKIINKHKKNNENDILDKSFDCIIACKPIIIFGILMVSKKSSDMIIIEANKARENMYH